MKLFYSYNFVHHAILLSAINAIKTLKTDLQNRFSFTGRLSYIICRAQQADLKIIVLDLEKCDLSSHGDLDLKHVVARQLSLNEFSKKFLTQNQQGNHQYHNNSENTNTGDGTENMPVTDTENENRDTCQNSEHISAEHIDLRDTIIVFNKSDLMGKLELDKLNQSLKKGSGDQGVTDSESELSEGVRVKGAESKGHTNKVTNKVRGHDIPACCISCLTGDGLDTLLDLLTVKVASM